MTTARGVRAAARADLMLRVYCYTAIEETKLRTLAESHEGSPGVPERGEVEELVASDAWVDLHAIVKGHVITGGSIGLKEVAPLAGFAWRDPEAGGDESMLWYREAVDGSEISRETARTRLLAYNEDDVVATLRLREWLEREAPKLPRVAALDLGGRRTCRPASSLPAVLRVQQGQPGNRAVGSAAEASLR